MQSTCVDQLCEAAERRRPSGGPYLPVSAAVTLPFHTANTPLMDM